MLPCLLLLLLLVLGDLGACGAGLTEGGREIFGPILALIPVKDVDEAIAFINER